MAKATLKPDRPARGGTRFAWRAGSRFPVPAAVAGAELDRIGRTNGGAVTPAAVVDAARDPDHPLHRAFVWDDSEAAERYRQDQARSLIRSIRVVVAAAEGPQTQTMYLNVTVRETESRAYLPARVVMSDAEYRAQALAEAMASLDGWTRRYGHLNELGDVFAAAAAARRKLRGK